MMTALYDLKYFRQDTANQSPCQRLSIEQALTLDEFS